MTAKRHRMADRVAEPPAPAYGAAADIPTALYERARQSLLSNEPLRARSSPAVSARGALSKVELNALESVGLSSRPWTGKSSADPLVQSIADYMALLETSLSTAEAAKYLDVDPSRVRQRLRERSLYGVDYDGEKRLPRFQFERHKVLPGLSDVLEALPAGLNPLAVVQWFLLPHPDLELEDPAAPMSPREWLLRGEPPAAIVALARMFE